MWPVSGGIPLKSPESVPTSFQKYKTPQVVKCRSRCNFASETEESTDTHKIIPHTLTLWIVFEHHSFASYRGRNQVGDIRRLTVELKC